MSSIPLKPCKISFGLLMLLLGFSILSELNLPNGNIMNLSLVKSTTISPFALPFEPSVGQLKGGEDTFLLTQNGNIYLSNTSQYLNTSVDNELSGIITFNTDRSDIYWLAKGIIAYQNGQIDSAINLWSNELNISSYFMWLSQVYDDPFHAINLIKLAIQISPTANGYFELGKRFEQENAVSDAHKAYQQAFDLTQKNNDNDLQEKVLIQIGEMYFLDGDYQSALKYFEKALLLNGYKTTWLTVRISQSLIRLGKFDLATQILEDLLDTQSDSAYAWWVLGNVRRRLGKTEEALEAYQEYKKLRPNDDRVLDRIEKLYIDKE